MNEAAQGLLNQNPTPTIPQQENVPPQQSSGPPSGIPAQNKPTIQPMRDYKQNPLNDQDRDEFDKLVMRATVLVHTPESREGIIKRITGRRSPLKDIADTAVAIMSMIDNQATKEGTPIDRAVRTLGISEIVKQVSEVASAAGKIDHELSDDELKVAIGQAVKNDLTNRIANGSENENAVRSAAQEGSSKMMQRQGVDTSAVDAQAQTAEQIRSVGTAPLPMPAKENPLAPKKTMTQVLASGGLLNG
jgi:hypothetical protein